MQQGFTSPCAPRLQTRPPPSAAARTLASCAMPSPLRRRGYTQREVSPTKEQVSGGVSLPGIEREIRTGRDRIIEEWQAVVRNLNSSGVR